MEELSKLFGSSARVKILRLFLFNRDYLFDIDTLIKRSRIDKNTLQKEINLLLKINFIETVSKAVEIEVKTKTNSSKKTLKNLTFYKINHRFTLLDPLQNLLIDSELVKTKELADRLQKNIKLKLLVLSGVFTNSKDSSADILVVGDKIDKKETEKAIKIIETEIGKELRYAIFETEEFIYRLKMFDKLLRDIFDYPYEMVIDKLKLPNY